MIKQRVIPRPGQCEMILPHHPDCEYPMCLVTTDQRCLKPAVGVVTESGIRVCAECASQMEREDFSVNYYERMQA